MNNNMTKLKVHNTHFFTGEEMEFFSTQSESAIIKASLVFGKNGSGKSTIVNLLHQFKNSINNDFSYLDFYDKQNNKINDEIVKENIHCFNENFIDQNVKISEDGLRTIVMLGEQIDVDNEILTKNQLLKSKEDELDKIDLDIFDNEKHTDSPKYHFNKIKATLNLPNGWAEMDRDVKSNKGKSRVTEEVVEKIINQKNSKSSKVLRDSYKDKMQYYEKVKDKTGTLNETVSKIKLSSTVTQISDILYKHINKPIGNEWSNRLAETLNKKGVSRLLEIEEQFSQDTKFCPYCLRDISDDEINEILKAINTLQNRDVKDFEMELNNLKIQQIPEHTVSMYTDVDISLVELIEKNIKKLNAYIVQLNNHIDLRINEIFEIPSKLNLDLDSLVDQINKNIDRLVNKVKQFNLDVKNSKKLKDELSSLTMQIAFHAIKNDHAVMLQKEKNKETLQVKHDTLLLEIQKLGNEIKSLESKKNRTDIAQDLINDYLTIIFYDKNRLKIVDDNGKYIVYSFGKEVPPRKLSTGERNAIALCYFFTTINNNLDKNNVFSRPLLVAIDDPVTSFDVDNRIGIFSFLRSMLYKVFSGNENSKVLLLTHKIDVYYDLQKVLSDCFNENNKLYKSFELKNKQLRKFEIKSTYKSLLREVYEFAKNENPEEYSVRTIGNVMRRVIESFSHFNYSLDLNKITNEEKILSKISDPNLRNYFTDFMHRLLLNNESHMRDTVSSIETNSFYEYVNIEEKVKTAKSLIVFLYQLDSFHITQNLKGLSKVDLKIRQWKNEIINGIE
jgi:ABC-type cobalamin/Fe3+-siderophores transport system ATPase subunit